ncbi:MAG: 3-hydroxybutyryl-CoA dehydrogenase [Acidobacteria bacterium]|nr:3-hydroxybutyryl-CoA dehydrogenase [Acidobacteriota bacterium]
MEIGSVGIVGCGLMGAGIAQCAAESGFEVFIKEVDGGLLQKGLARIHGRWERALAKNKATPLERDTWASRLKGTTAWDGFADCDLVIEAVPERLELKLRTFADLDRVMAPSTLLCTNTSSLSVTELSASLGPDRQPFVAGLHFFNPVPAMPLVEIVRTLATGEGTLEALKGFVQRLGKTPVMAPDAPGFVVNRLLVPYLLDAMRCAEARLASVEDIDAAMSLGCGHPMGPLHLSDFIGLDTMLSVAEVLHDAFGEPRFKAPPLLRQMVTAGRLGRKSGLGFYRWDKDERQEAAGI